MKTILTFLCVSILSASANAAAPAVGSVAVDQKFVLARESSTGFNAASLNDYEGKILILMMMTPWCPICQSHAQAVGNGLLDHFDNPSRGALRGKNDNGVPIESVLLSTEEAASWDQVNESFSTTNGFDRWGLDANTQRQNPRELLGYFRGGFINSSNLYDWGNDRRRVVVLNLVKGSASHSFREIVINRNSYSSGNNTAAKAAINGILAREETPSPRIELDQGKTMLESGTSTVDFGKVVPGTSTVLSFTLRNTGGSDLSGLTTSVGGQHASDFQVNGPADTTLGPDEATSFTVVFSPSGEGTRKAVLNLASASTGGPSFIVNLSGESGQAEPEIEVYQPATSKLVDGRAKRSFGTAKIGNKGRSLTFRVTNTGDAVLKDLSLTRTGGNPKDFIISKMPGTQLAPRASTTFKVTFMPRGTGTRSTTLSLKSNDGDESPFDISVSGLGAK